MGEGRGGEQKPQSRAETGVKAQRYTRRAEQERRDTQNGEGEDGKEQETGGTGHPGIPTGWEELEQEREGPEDAGREEGDRQTGSAWVWCFL